MEICPDCGSDHTTVLPGGQKACFACGYTWRRPIVRSEIVTRRQAEAFCLMKYVRKSDGFIEWVWNSRDGVTPFGIGGLGKEAMLHDDWHEDAFIPNFVPPIGMRVFVGPPDAPELIEIKTAADQEPFRNRRYIPEPRLALPTIR